MVGGPMSPWRRITGYHGEKTDKDYRYLYRLHKQGKQILQSNLPSCTAYQ